MKTKIYNYSRLTPQDTAEIASALKNGALAILPTDTVYGLVCCACAPGGLEALNKLKQNPQSKPPQILCSLEQAFAYAQDGAAFRRAASLWPGALTLIVNRAETAPSFLSGMNTLGLRVAKDDFVLNLIAALQAPLFATSANIHGKPVCGTEAEILDGFENKPGIIVLNGDLRGEPSALLDITGGAIKILRGNTLLATRLEKLMESL